MTEKLLLRAFVGPTDSRPPFWLMRQAGRFLPEYRALRAQCPNFLSFCATPELTIESALQPLRRFRMDAAILFSDILVVPAALGQPVAFVEDKGPVLEPVRDAAAVAALQPDGALERLQPSVASVRGLRASLSNETALIGFAGAPWTVALYMVEGRGGTDGPNVRRWGYRAPDDFARLIEVLVDVTAEYLIAQIEAGADVVQLFDTWAGLLSERQFRRWVIEPTAAIVGRVKASVRPVPIIGFPRGAGPLLVDYAEETGIDGLGLDAGVPLSWASRELQPHVLLQGNVDNQALVVGGSALRSAAQDVLETLSDGRFIFNLGHGVLPDTPPETVAELAELIRGWTRPGVPRKPNVLRTP